MLQISMLLTFIWHQFIIMKRIYFRFGNKPKQIFTIFFYTEVLSLVNNNEKYTLILDIVNLLRKT